MRHICICAYSYAWSTLHRSRSRYRCTCINQLPMHAYAWSTPRPIEFKIWSTRDRDRDLAECQIVTDCDRWWQVVTGRDSSCTSTLQRRKKYSLSVANERVPHNCNNALIISVIIVKRHIIIFSLCAITETFARQQARLSESWQERKPWQKPKLWQIVSCAPWLSLFYAC